jgi:hypothetical protein
MSFVYHPRQTVFVTTSFVGFHHWPGAPDHLSHLRDRHRHVFGVRLTIGVFHHDREVEFQELKWHLDFMLESAQEWPLAASCEDMAERILTWLQARHPYRPYYAVEVNEDGENGATIEWTGEDID